MVCQCYGLQGSLCVHSVLAHIIISHGTSDAHKIVDEWSFHKEIITACMAIMVDNRTERSYALVCSYVYLITDFALKLLLLKIVWWSRWPLRLLIYR